MARKRFNPEQVIKMLKKLESVSSNKEICGQYGISEQMFYNW